MTETIVLASILVQNRFFFKKKMTETIELQSVICHLSDGSSESDLTDRMTDSSADETDDLNHLILNLILYILNNMHFKFY
jgi:hypothetical protein